MIQCRRQPFMENGIGWKIYDHRLKTQLNGRLNAMKYENFYNQSHMKKVKKAFEKNYIKLCFITLSLSLYYSIQQNQYFWQNFNTF